MQTDRKQHWEGIYSTKQPQQYSWFQEYPSMSMHFISTYNIPQTARIIDVGGGDSLLVDALLEAGYTNITVLDIADAAIQRAQLRLADRANSVTWIVADIMEYTPTESFDVWHDRAAFHFLTNHQEVEEYVTLAQKSIKTGGLMTVGTFSESGPDRCSGLPVHQYSERSLQTTLQRGFEKIRCIEEEHRTPFATLQKFLFCSFRRN